jgi:hypothetical protein
MRESTRNTCTSSLALVVTLMSFGVSQTEAFSTGQLPQTFTAFGGRSLKKKDDHNYILPKNRISVCSSMSAAYADNNGSGSAEQRGGKGNDASLESSIQSFKNMTQTYLDDLATAVAVEEEDDYDGEAVGNRLRKQSLTVGGRLQAKRASSTRVGEKATVLTSDEIKKTMVYEAAFPLYNKDSSKSSVPLSPFPPPLVVTGEGTTINNDASVTGKAASSSFTIGMTLRQVSATNGQLSSIVLDLDTQQYLPAGSLSQESLQAAGVVSVTLVLPPDLMERSDDWDGDLAGVLVSSVNTNCYAYRAGVRPGDWILATSATIGEVRLI